MRKTLETLSIFQTRGANSKEPLDFLNQIRSIDLIIDKILVNSKMIISFLKTSLS